MNTFLLDTVLWDLCVDAAGNIAVATDSYSVVQDVSSACRVFQGDEFYDVTAGIPYFQKILAQPLSATFFKAQIAGAAAAVPGCNNPVVFISGVSGRGLTGQVQFTDNNGVAQVAGF